MYIEKIQKGWKELDEEIIKKGKCVYCGACGAFCASIKFDTEKQKDIVISGVRVRFIDIQPYSVSYTLSSS